MRPFNHVLPALASLVAAGVLGVSTPACAATKPAGDLVPAGAKVLLFSAPPSSGARSVTVTNATTIARVRTLINGLPVSSTAHQVCPDDMMLPYTVSFSRSAKATPFTRVVFQLGGCPYARVYQLGVPVTPTLGGSTLAAVFAQIRALVNPTT